MLFLFNYFLLLVLQFLLFLVLGLILLSLVAVLLIYGFVLVGFLSFLYTHSGAIIYFLVTSCTRAVFALLKRIGRGGGEEEEVGNPHNHNDEDIISQLPDDILVSIIARTPTRFIVSTSILSKRWRNLYKSVPSFKLKCRDLLSHDTPRYSTHVHHSDFGLTVYRLERFLTHCSGSMIHCFHLQCCLTESYANPFDQCIYSLGKLGVKELTLSLSCCVRPTYVPFSCHILSKLPSLKYLSLSMCSLQPKLNSKCYSLQTLELSYVTFVTSSLECILSNCLALHSLKINSCQCPPKLCLRGPNLQLKTLIFIHCEDVVEIEFYASNLTTFEFKCNKMVNFVFDHVPQLETVCISYHWKWNNIMPYVVGKLSEDLPHLKSLCFETRGDFYQESNGFMPKVMETFGNLRRLDMSVCCTPRTNLLALTPFLETCPLLEEFHFDARNMDHDVDVQRKPVVHLHTKLKMVEITGFCGTVNEIEFALYILKSAVALEQMFIIRSVRYYDGCGRWVKRSETPWKKETRNKIEQRLQGKALSKTAKLIILDESIFLRSIHHEHE